MSSTRRLIELGRSVAADLERIPANPDAEQATRRVLAEQVRAGRPGRPVKKWAAIAAAAAAVSVAAFLLVPRSLTFTVGSQAGGIGTRVSAPATREVPIIFSDGTKITLLPGTRARILDVSARGARVAVEAGPARLDVRPSIAASWSVEAGPFVVSVTGTRFVVGWSAEHDTLQLDLYEGSVDVTGCAMTTRHLVAGQRLEAGCRSQRVHVTPLFAAPPTPFAETPRAAIPTTGVATGEDREVANVVPPPLATGAAIPRAPSPVAPAAPTPNRDAPTEERSSSSTWLDRAKAGQFALAFDGAVEAGLPAQLGSAGEDALFHFAEAARLSGHPEEARRAYDTLRRRFAGSSRASASAFALARLALDRGDPGSARTLLETYLAEAPSGALASAALGRLLELDVQAHDVSRARARATEYLARFPRGPHADEAKRVLGDAAPRAD